MAGEEDELPPDALRLVEKAAGPEPRQKRQRLTRRTRMRQHRREESNLNVGGLLGSSDYGLLKQLVRERASHLCEKCGRENRRLTPHHRKLLSQGGYDGADNLASLCSQDHDWCHEHPVEAMAAGWIVPSYENPATYPMLLFDGRRVILTPGGEYEQAA